MDDERCRQFFREPEGTFQRRYEALRAFFVEGRPLHEIADQFGYKAAALRVMLSRFRTRCHQGDIPPFFFANPEDDPRANDESRTPTGPRAPRRPIVAP
jgi:hypothetical protein